MPPNHGASTNHAIDHPTYLPRSYAPENDEKLSQLFSKILFCLIIIIISRNGSSGDVR